MMLTFFIVLACAMVLYYLIPLKHRWIVLLAASIIFLLRYQYVSYAVCHCYVA